MSKLKNTIVKVLEYACIILFLLITIIGLYQVFSRYLFNSPKAWSEEALSNGFAWMALLGSALVFGKRDHMRLTFIIANTSRSTQKKIEILNEIIIFLFSLIVFVLGGIAIFNLTKAQISPALQWSTGGFYLAIPICGVLTCIFAIANILEIKNDKNFEIEKEEA